MPDVTIPEPDDMSIVAWMQSGVPMKVYVRADSFTSNKSLDRWYDADEERGAREGAVDWATLHIRHRHYGWSGPYVLHVGELLGGTDG
jgi:hypothetical protein